jgi:hypothetical protein
MSSDSPDFSGRRARVDARIAGDPGVEDVDDPLVVTLSAPAARKTRAAAQAMGVRPPEAIRRGLSLLQLFLSLEDGEYLAIRRSSGELERVLVWPDP